MQVCPSNFCTRPRSMPLAEWRFCLGLALAFLRQQMQFCFTNLGKCDHRLTIQNNATGSTARASTPTIKTKVNQVYKTTCSCIFITCTCISFCVCACRCQSDVLFVICWCGLVAVTPQPTPESANIPRCFTACNFLFEPLYILGFFCPPTAFARSIVACTFSKVSSIGPTLASSVVVIVVVLVVVVVVVAVVLLRHRYQPFDRHFTAPVRPRLVATSIATATTTRAADIATANTDCCRYRLATPSYWHLRRSLGG